MRSNQTGGAALFVIVILAVIAGCGYYLYQNSEKKQSISSFQECADAGYPVQESYPEVCVTKDGKRFPNPEQTLR